jgi:L-lactate dehydrogenase complex protein LldF
LADNLWISILEPAAKERQRQFSRIIVRKGAKPDLEDIKAHLKKLREYASENHSSLLAQLKSNISNYQGVQLATASNAEQAVAYIKEVADGIKLISVNKSSVISNELKPELKNSGFNVYVRYFKEFEDFDKRITDYWQLPGFHEKGLTESFDIATTITQLKSSQVRDYVAVLGVNAISAQDCSVFFLQHFSNILKDLEQARKVILVVAIDKIVKDREDAAFQTRCMGIFGAESALLDLRPKEAERYDFDALPTLPEGQGRELHVLLLDNGRGDLLHNGFEQLFLCINCRACARQCPIGQPLSRDDAVWSPKNYLFMFLLGRNPSTEACLHCGRCYVECPVEIDTPTLIWKAQVEHAAKYGRPWKKRLLDNPELMAKFGSLMTPLSNIARDNSLFKTTLEMMVGIHRKASLPPFHRHTFWEWVRRGGRGE